MSPTRYFLRARKKSIVFDKNTYSSQKYSLDQSLIISSDDWKCGWFLTLLSKLDKLSEPEILRITPNSKSVWSWGWSPFIISEKNHAMKTAIFAWTSTNICKTETKALGYWIPARAPLFSRRPIEFCLVQYQP